MIMLKKEMLISPERLYPTESLVFIKNDVLQMYFNAYKNGIELEKPLVFLFDDNYYIYEGHHLVLAAIMAKIKEICVQVVELKENSFWGNEENIKDTLKSVGMTTLFDFEAIGDFTYQTYPSYYSR